MNYLEFRQILHNWQKDQLSALFLPVPLHGGPSTASIQCFLHPRVSVLSSSVPSSIMASAGTRGVMVCRDVVSDLGLVIPVCFASKTSDSRKSSLDILLIPSQIRARATVDTGNCTNPFAILDSSTETSVLLRTSCRCKKTGWGAICNSKRTGKHNIVRYWRAWKTRLRCSRRHSGTRCCIVCSSQKQTPVPNNVEFERSRVPAAAAPARCKTKPACPNEGINMVSVALHAIMATAEIVKCAS